MPCDTAVKVKRLRVFTFEFFINKTAGSLCMMCVCDFSLRSVAQPHSHTYSPYIFQYLHFLSCEPNLENSKKLNFNQPNRQFNGVNLN